MTRKHEINWSRKSHNYTKEELTDLVDFLNTTDSFTQDVQKEKFEKEFSEYTDNPNCFAVSSCTSALELTAALMNIQKGDEIIAPAHTFCATVMPYLRFGAIIKWADIDMDTRVISAETIRPLITPKTKAIVLVHLYGLMCDMDPIMELAREHGIKVVEDNAQSLGATYKGKKCGTFGDYACYSFHTQKNITTLGEGGILSVKNDDEAKRVSGLMHNGLALYPQREEYWIPAMSDVQLDPKGVIPYNFCLSEPQCFLGRKVLKRIENLNQTRIERAEYLKTELKDYPELVFQKIPSDEYKHVYHLLPAMFDGSKFGKNRDDLIRLLFNEYGIQAIVQYYPLYRYPLFKDLGLGEANCPNTDNYFDNMISFPFYVWASKEEFDYEINSIKEAIDRLRG
ncbi:MAG: DegT/DnrJ/EryC1/StrS family aminotransferase [Bacteriovoracaceae bacterium]|jgi:perosamine synthetase|nr:DegT/DnrJ/EryC1/StrS family aminotransferase [Bacteriovoracaceae bacterium]